MDDLISRQAAIDAIEKYNFNFPEYMERFITELRDAMKEDLKEDIADLPSAHPETRPIGYQECANAMLKMWIDNVVTDGEYSRIMDKLNSYWKKNDE